MSLKKIFVTDIGGTNCRFACYVPKGDGVALEHSKVYPSTGDFVDLLEQAVEDGAAPSDPEDVFVIAAAGAVIGNVCDLTNTDICVDLDHPRFTHNIERTVLMNDFVAQALGCLYDRHNAEVLREGEAEPGAVEAVVGAGTGLGHCALVPRDKAGKVWQPIPTETGHGGFAFECADEAAYAEFIKKKTGVPYVHGDYVVTGGALSYLHEFLTGRELTPAEVAAEIDAESETACMFARFYGRAARNFVIAMVAYGGLHITGGVAAKNPYLVNHPEFFKSLNTAVFFEEQMAKLPVWFYPDTDLGLFGAAMHGLRKFG